METQGEYRGLPYESDSELYFLFWYFELEDKNMVHGIYRSQSYRTSDGLAIEYPVQKKSSIEMKRQVLLKPSVYTPDYTFIGGGYGLFQMINKPVNLVMDGDEHSGTVRYDREIVHEQVKAPLVATYIFDFPEVSVECKPDFDQNNMTRLFKINQKIVWDKYQKFINLVETNKFFARTFTPAKYLKTKTGKDRKLNYTPKTLEEYLNDK